MNTELPFAEVIGQSDNTGAENRTRMQPLLRKIDNRTTVASVLQRIALGSWMRTWLPDGADETTTVELGFAELETLGRS
jgi:hypothetical protein